MKQEMNHEQLKAGGYKTYILVNGDFGYQMFPENKSGLTPECTDISEDAIRFEYPNDNPRVKAKYWSAVAGVEFVPHWLCPNCGQFHALNVCCDVKAAVNYAK